MKRGKEGRKRWMRDGGGREKEKEGRVENWGHKERREEQERVGRGDRRERESTNNKNRLKYTTSTYNLTINTCGISNTPCGLSSAVCFSNSTYSSPLAYSNYVYNITGLSLSLSPLFFFLSLSLLTPLSCLYLFLLLSSLSLSSLKN